MADAGSFDARDARQDPTAGCRGPKLTVRLRVADTIPRLPAEVELAVFRAAQEPLANAVRHAGATDIEVTLTAGERTLHLEVRDNGRVDGTGGTTIRVDVPR